MGLGVSRIGRDNNRTNSASARVLSGPSVCSPRGKTRARTTGVARGDNDVSKLQPPTWRSNGEEEPRPMAWGVARRALATNTEPRQVRQHTSAPWAVGRFCTGRRAREPCAMGIERGDNDILKPQPPT